MEVVPVSSATNGDYDDDLGHGYIRRPISVAQLLEREGYRPAARSRATRRALTGVAAGAVLALGAVVGSLLLNHASGNSAGDTLASGANIGDVMLSNGSHQQAAITPAPQAHATGGQVGDAAVANTTQPQIVQNGGQAATKPVNRAATTPANPNLVTPATTNTTQSTLATTNTNTSTPVTPATSSGTTTPATSTAPPPSTKPATPAPATSSSSGGGGLLGTVTGTLAGTLNSVTQPVFSWFG
jgi:hypothetical protein